MKVEREIAGFSLPFAAGVALATYAGSSSYDIHIINASVSLTAVSAALSLAMHPAGRRISHSWTAIAFLALLLGGFCGECGKLLWISAIDPADLRGWSIGMKMQEMADAVPFTDRSTNAIVKALLTGERCDIPQEITVAFRDSGASHILALSGLHLGIIYGITRYITSFFGNTRQALIARSAATIAICLTYTLATGAGASIVRALLFIIINEAARMTHRHHSTGSVLMTSLVVQLAISPSSVQSVGFQLSYAAMAGIAFLFPWMKSLWPGQPHEDKALAKCTRWIWNSASMSISCQITTGPLAWYYFNSFPMHFMLTNLIALPLTGLIIPSALAVMLLSSMGLCPGFMIRGTEFLISLLTDALSVISGM